MDTRIRTEMSDDEVKIHEAAISSSIKKDFLKHDLSYQDTKTMQCLAGYKRNTGDSRREVRRILLENFNASIVAVGANKVAIVKRPQPQEK